MVHKNRNRKTVNGRHTPPTKMLKQKALHKSLKEQRKFEQQTNPNRIQVVAWNTIKASLLSFSRKRPHKILYGKQFHFSIPKEMPIKEVNEVVVNALERYLETKKEEILE